MITCALYWLSFYLWHNVTEQPLSPELKVETGEEKEVSQQLQQANDTAARLQRELRRATDREQQLQQQLDKMKLEMEYHSSKITDCCNIRKFQCKE